MGAMRTVYDAFVVMYGLSLVLFFMDAMQPRRVVNRVAVVLLFCAFSLETIFLLERLVSLGYVPVYNPFDATLLISWLVLLIALCINSWFRLDLILFFVNIVGFSLVVADAVSRESSYGINQRTSDLLVMHISSALLSYAAFLLAGVFAGMFLIQEHSLRQKLWNPFYFRFPSQDRLDLMVYRSILGGFPLLTVAIVLGGVWEKASLGHLVWLDAKPLMTLLVWALYGFYIVLRIKAGWGGRTLSWYALLCLAAVLINLWTAGRFSSFHHEFS